MMCPKINKQEKYRMATIESVMHEARVFAPSAEIIKNAHISGMEAYEALCAEAERDYTGYWARLAREYLDWQQPFSTILDESKAPTYQWFTEGKLNASWNCLDRQVNAGLGDKVALI